MAVAVAMLSTVGAQAQKLGFHIGYSSQHLPAYTLIEHKPVVCHDLSGVFLNIDYTFKLSQHWGVTAGLGGRFNLREYPTTLTFLPATTEEQQIVVDVPVLASFSVPLSDYATLSLFLGPMVSFGITGTSTVTEQLYGNSVKALWYEANPVYKRLDLQGTGGLAVDVQHLRIFGGYSMGILSLNPNEGPDIKTTAFYLGLGYTL